MSDFLRRERFTPSQLWDIVKPHLDDSDTSVVIADDSVQDKRYSHFIELVKRTRATSTAWSRALAL